MQLAIHCFYFDKSLYSRVLSVNNTFVGRRVTVENPRSFSKKLVILINRCYIWTTVKQCVLMILLNSCNMSLPQYSCGIISLNQDFILQLFHNSVLNYEKYDHRYLMKYSCRCSAPPAKCPPPQNIANMTLIWTPSSIDDNLCIVVETGVEQIEGWTDWQDVKKEVHPYTTPLVRVKW